MTALLLCLGCSEDELDGGLTGVETTGDDNTLPDDLSRFAGSWLVTKADVEDVLYCAPGACRDVLRDVLSEVYGSSSDTVCVRIEKTRHLTLVEPFYSEGDLASLSGSADITGNAEIRFAYRGELAGVMMTNGSAKVVVNLDGDDRFQAFISFDGLIFDGGSGEECGTCRAILGAMKGIRAPVGRCDP